MTDLDKRANQKSALFGEQLKNTSYITLSLTINLRLTSLHFLKIPDILIENTEVSIFSYFGIKQSQTMRVFEMFLMIVACKLIPKFPKRKKTLLIKNGE